LAQLLGCGSLRDDVLSVFNGRLISGDWSCHEGSPSMMMETIIALMI
jgi:hypothetical protein